MKKAIIGVGVVLLALALAVGPAIGASATNSGVESLKYTNGQWTLTLTDANASEVKLIKPGEEISCSEHEGQPKNGHALCDSLVYTFASQADCVMVQIDWTGKAHNSSDPEVCRGDIPVVTPPKDITEVYSWELPNGGTESNVTWPQTLVGPGDLTPTKCDVTYQVDTYVGTREEIDAVVGDGILTGSAEDSGIISKWHYTAGPKCAAVPPVVVPPVEPPVVIPPVVTPPVCEEGQELQPAGDSYVCGPADEPTPTEPTAEPTETPVTPTETPVVPEVTDTPTVAPVVPVTATATPEAIPSPTATVLAETGAAAWIPGQIVAGILILGGLALVVAGKLKRRS